MAEWQSGHLRPRRVRARPPEAAPKEVGPRKVKAPEPPPIVMGERFVQAIEDLAKAPVSYHLQAAEAMAAEVGCSTAEAMRTIGGILDAKARRDASRREADSFQRGHTGRSKPIVVRVRDLRPADTLIDTIRFAGEVVRWVSVGNSGLNAVVVFQGRSDDDGWALRANSTIRVRRG